MFRKLYGMFYYGKCLSLSGFSFLIAQLSYSCEVASDGQISFQKYFENRKQNSFKTILKILL